jgi:pimeloyl-ACP methyl ester carboxylesterase
MFRENANNKSKPTRPNRPLLASFALLAAWCANSAAEIQPAPNQALLNTPTTQMVTGSVLLPAAAPQPALHVRWQLAESTANAPNKALDVIYVHGATFPASLAVFFDFDGRSCANALNEAGFNVWAFDFAGYGKSGAYSPTLDALPRGRVDEAAPQLQRVIEFVKTKNGGRPVALVAHSWGALVALRVASQMRDHVSHLALFAPIASRSEQLTAPKLPPLRPLSTWEQYRKFIEDVPRGHAPILLDRHFERWAEAYLATDATNTTRTPRSVMVPTGPITDLIDTWNGKTLYSAEQITQPTLVIRGEWDSVSTETDAAILLASIASKTKSSVKIPKGTHLMHLEESRGKLHDSVNTFLRAQQP